MKLDTGLTDNLTNEQKKRFLEAASAEEVLAMAQQEGINLTDEQMELVSGGSWSAQEQLCSKCGSTNIRVFSLPGYVKFICEDCGFEEGI